MADEITLPRKQEYCHRLRCKEMFIYTDEAFDLKDSGSGLYWCAHTQNCMGPDGKAVYWTECKPGRTCYELP